MPPISVPRRRRRSPARLAAVILSLSVLSAGAAPKPPVETPDAAPVPPDAQMLTDGIWVGSTAAGQTVFQLVRKEDRWTGHSYLVRDGKALLDNPVVAAAVETVETAGTAQDAAPATRLEIRLQTGWTYRGQLSADGRELDGDLDMGGGRRQQLHLSRLPLDAVPGVLPRPSAEEPYVYRRPAETEDGWATASATDAGLELAQIQGLVGDVVAGDAGLIHSLLLVKGDKLVVEEYFHGFRREDLHAIHSCTKSVASLLVGVAIQRGELGGVETPLSELFPDLLESAAPGWTGLRLEHLLTMTSGTEWRGGTPPAGPALVRASLQRPPIAPVGTAWRYSDLDADLLAAVLQRATGVQADAYAARYLFAPLEITGWDWEGGKVDGFPRLYGTLRLRPRDMAKLGELVLAGGTWQDRRVVSEEWIRESTRQHVDTGGEGYGYLWWREPVPPTFPGEVISARGVGSQLIYVAPRLDLVIVVTGGNNLNGLDSRIGEVLMRHLLPDLAAGATTRGGGSRRP